VGLLNRKEFLKKAWDTGMLLFGSSALFEVIAAEDLFKKNKAEASKKIQWSMLVDVPKCLKAGDCTECITACHAAHNVPNIADKKREIKWIWKEKYEHTFPGDAYEHVRDDIKTGDMMVLCNHCENPPCVRVCPTDATWRRKDGIVMMDMHRCIGCRYCMAACPYGSRSFNWSDPKKAIPEKAINPDYPTRSKGVVEKCSFCDERVDRGLLPACVVSCKEKALIFGNINDPGSEVRKSLKKRFAIRRKASLGTGPQVYYLL
jgi:Fe-S-cluster-containing dehydrogenase component